MCRHVFIIKNEQTCIYNEKCTDMYVFIMKMCRHVFIMKNVQTCIYNEKFSGWDEEVEASENAPAPPPPAWWVLFF